MPLIHEGDHNSIGNVRELPTWLAGSVSRMQCPSSAGFGSKKYVSTYVTAGNKVLVNIVFFVRTNTSLLSVQTVGRTRRSIAASHRHDLILIRRFADPFKLDNYCHLRIRHPIYFYSFRHAGIAQSPNVMLAPRVIYLDNITCHCMPLHAIAFNAIEFFAICSDLSFL